MLKSIFIILTITALSFTYELNNSTNNQLLENQEIIEKTIEQDE